jgi:hypothetical protein
MITVLYPRPVKRVGQMRLSLRDAIYYPKRQRASDEIEEKQPRDLIVTLDEDADRLFSRAVIEVPQFNRALHTGTVRARGESVNLSVKIGTDRRAEGGDGSFAVKIRRQGSKVTGEYSGTYRGERRQGAVEGEYVTGVLSSQGHWEETTPPPMRAIAGGVQVGDDRVVFAGSIEEDQELTAVTAERDAQAVLTLTAEEIDLDRFQGEIGLFVPDTGYPFGRIPDWLIRQRVQRPDTSMRRANKVE